ncbi:MAG: septum formation protein [Saprospiraceae bacterium]|jgi:septum formation protein
MHLPRSLNHLIEKQIILGSASPRRAELLSGLGILFEIRISGAEETVPEGLPPIEYVSYLSELKANTLKSTLRENEILITADTIVCINDTILNKPKDKLEASKMLKELSGMEHKVITGITCTTTKGMISDADTARVQIIKMDEDEILFYIDKYNPMDKAGAYGIQEWFGLAMIRSIIGSYYTIMGLPSHKLYHMLKHDIKSIL